MPGPRITAVDLVIGTVFAGNHDAPTGAGSRPQLAIYSMITHAGTVSAQGLLATVTFTLAMKDTLNGTSDFGPDGNGDTIFPAIADGTFQVMAPEPSTFRDADHPGGGVPRHATTAKRDAGVGAAHRSIVSPPPCPLPPDNSPRVSLTR